MDRSDAVEDGVRQQVANGAERLVGDGLPFVPLQTSQCAEVVQPGADVGQSPLLVVLRDASADIDAGLCFQIPAVENGHVRGAAPDVEVRGHTAVLLGKGFRAGAAPRQDGLKVRTRGGHDELAGQRAQLVDDDLGVLLERALARDDDGTGVHVFGANARGAVLLLDDLPYGFAVQQVPVLLRSEVQRASIDDVLCRDAHFGHPVGRRRVGDAEPGDDHARRRGTDVDAHAENVLLHVLVSL